MKTSNMLIIIAIILLFVSSAATNLTLKKEFDKIDKTDPAFGFTKHTVASFSHIKMTGRGFGLTEIRQAAGTQIRTIVKEDALRWKVANDTLFLTYKPEWNFVGYADLYGKPSIYIYTPRLASVQSDSIVSRIHEVKGDSLYVRQSGRGMLISGSNFKKLDVKVNRNGFLKLADKNAFVNADLQISDKSTLEVDKNVFTKLKTSIDSTAQIKVPGSMVKAIAAQ